MGKEGMGAEKRKREGSSLPCGLGGDAPIEAEAWF